MKAAMATRTKADGQGEVAQLRQEVRALTDIVVGRNSLVLSLLAAAPPDFLGTEEARP